MSRELHISTGNNELFDNQVSYTDGGRKFKTQITLGNGGQFSNIKYVSF